MHKLGWIYTGVMVADPLTKVMENTTLECLLTGGSICLNIEQPIDFVVKTVSKQLQRRKTGGPCGTT